MTVAPDAGPMIVARSIAELRQQHVALLSYFRDEPDPAVKAARAEALRRAAQALGAWLEDDEERDAAQGVIDYWTAAIAGLPNQSFPALISPDPLNETRCADCAAAGETIVAHASDKTRALVDTMFLRLLRVGSDNRLAHGPPVSRGELFGPATNAALDAVVDQLAEADVLCIRPGASRSEDAIEFASSPVARRWPRLDDLLKQRRDSVTRDRLRAIAQLWEHSDRNQGYLLSGTSLDDAGAFLTDDRDTANITLNAFILASRERAARDTMRVRQAIIIGPSLAILLLVGIGLLGNWHGQENGQKKGEVVGAADANAIINNESQTVGAAPPNNAPLPAETALGPIGYIWIGNDSLPNLQNAETGAMVAAADVHANVHYRVRGNANLVLREAAATADGASARPSPPGLAPANSLVVALAEPTYNDRPSGRQYWLKVRIVPKLFIQFSGTNDGRPAKLADALRKTGFDVQKNQQRDDYIGTPKVRFYYGSDATVAQKLTQSAMLALGEADHPVAVRCELSAIKPPPPPTVLELWVSYRERDLPGAAPAGAGAPRCSASAAQ